MLFVHFLSFFKFVPLSMQDDMRLLNKMSSHNAMLLLVYINANSNINTYYYRFRERGHGEPATIMRECLHRNYDPMKHAVNDLIDLVNAL